MDADTDLEDLMGLLGDFGTYSKQQYLLHLLPALTFGMHMLSVVTVAAVPEHRCLVPGENATETWNWDSPQVKEWIPTNGGVLDSCKKYNNSDKSGVASCSEWVFDETYHPSTRVKQWSMVCDRGWMRAAVQVAYMLGVCLGSVFIGSLSDRYGRKNVVCVSCVLQLFLGIILALINEFYTYLALRFIFGVFGPPGAFSAAFVMTMELIGPGKRTACGVFYGAPFALGVILVAFWGWLIPSAFYLQIIYALHSLSLIGHWWLLDESPRWLWAQGRRQEVVELVRKALRINGGGLLDSIYDDVIRSKPMVIREGEKEPGILSLVRTPNLRKRTFIICLNWFANNMAYLGLTLNANTLPGNPYLMLFASAVLELPSFFTTSYIMEKLGRRTPICSFMIFGGVACLASAFTPGATVSIVVVMVGKFLVTSSYSITFNYTAELYPTVVRNTAMGVGEMCARIGGVPVPCLTLLGSFDTTLPTMVFATITVISGVLSLQLPETRNKPMPQTIEGGEAFGNGDTACSNCFSPTRIRD